MPLFPVSPEKQKQLEERMARLGLFESDLIEDFVKGGGAGGQKINKTSVAVFLQHRPSGLSVRCQESRSQALNRFIARRMICDKLEERILGKLSEQQQLREKIRRQKRKRSKRAKEKMLDSKRHHAIKKESRRRPEY